jgi:hypothetical protein
MRSKINGCHIKNKFHSAWMTMGGCGTMTYRQESSMAVVAYACGDENQGAEHDCFDMMDLSLMFYPSKTVRALVL